MSELTEARDQLYYELKTRFAKDGFKSNKKNFNFRRPYEGGFHKITLSVRIYPGLSMLVSLGIYIDHTRISELVNSFTYPLSLHYYKERSILGTNMINLGPLEVVQVDIFKIADVEMAADRLYQLYIELGEPIFGQYSNLESIFNHLKANKAGRGSLTMGYPATDAANAMAGAYLLHRYDEIQSIRDGAMERFGKSNQFDKPLLNCVYEGLMSLSQEK